MEINDSNLNKGDESIFNPFDGGQEKTPNEGPVSETLGDVVSPDDEASGLSRPKAPFQGFADAPKKENLNNDGFFHPRDRSFFIPYKLFKIYEAKLAELGFPRLEDPLEHTLNLASVMEKGSNLDVGEALTYKSRRLQKRISKMGGKPIIQLCPFYTLCDLLSTSGLLGLMLLYPIHFKTDVLKLVMELFLIIFEIQKALYSYLNKTFYRQLNVALNNINFNNDVVFKPATQDQKILLVHALGFEFVSRALQGGVGLNGKNKIDFSIESSLVEGACIQSSIIRKILERVLTKYNWTFRKFARVISPFIFAFSYKNRIDGYLANKLERYLIPTESETLRAYEISLLNEIHANGPFVTPQVKKILKDHEKKCNKK